MQRNLPNLTPRSERISVETVRRDARRFVDALASRLGELEHLAEAAKRFQVFSAAEYVEFQRLFRSFSELSEEFQILSHITEDSLGRFRRSEEAEWIEHKRLDEYFRRLQIPMLHSVIRTNLHLLRVWDDRWRRGQGLPYGAREVFIETIRVIYNARAELLRPRYLALLDETAARDADRANRMLRVLVQQAPSLFNFADDDAQDPLFSAGGYDGRAETKEWRSL